jgi:hypothetical protein
MHYVKDMCPRFACIALSGIIPRITLSGMIPQITLSGIIPRIALWQIITVDLVIAIRIDFCGTLERRHSLALKAQPTWRCDLLKGSRRAPVG